MNLHEALQWLDERGGRWSVRASSAVCMVVVAVGSSQVVVPATNLTPEEIDDALVDAVQELRTTMIERKAS